jgi:hypothetical protein
MHTSRPPRSVMDWADVCALRARTAMRPPAPPRQRASQFPLRPYKPWKKSPGGAGARVPHARDGCLTSAARRTGLPLRGSRAGWSLGRCCPRREYGEGSCGESYGLLPVSARGPCRRPRPLRCRGRFRRPRRVRWKPASPLPRSARTSRTTTTTSAATAGASSMCGRDPAAFARARLRDARGRQGSGRSRRCCGRESYPSGLRIST